MRKLATIEKVKEIKAIEGADKIELAIVKGWQTVIKKGEFKPGDLCIYIEVDSWVPHELAPFLSKGKEARIYEGVSGERLRTIKLRGQISQGLILPNTLNKLEGDDVTEDLGILKWERVIPANLSGIAIGDFPSFISKTEQERIQNSIDFFVKKYQGELFEVTEKLDGSSCTIYKRDDQIGVCTRNLELSLEEENQKNAYVKAAQESGLLDFFKLNPNYKNLAFQCELVGPGIQKNYKKITEIQLKVFDIFDIDQHKYLSPTERYLILEEMQNNPDINSQILNPVNILEKEKKVDFKSVDEFLNYSESFNTDRTVEGLVFKHIKSSFSFKVINNSYLLRSE